MFPPIYKVPRGETRRSCDRRTRDAGTRHGPGQALVTHTPDRSRHQKHTWKPLTSKRVDGRDAPHHSSRRRAQQGLHPLPSQRCSPTANTLLLMAVVMYHHHQCSIVARLGADLSTVKVQCAENGRGGGKNRITPIGPYRLGGNRLGRCRTIAMQVWACHNSEEQAMDHPRAGLMEGVGAGEGHDWLPRGGNALARVDF
ncbi:hypothetical protein K461DRAFT_164089 [Myriangium duriaei CBS 260.36]|uniref:Uncharacterized protein n=1 Tax=Myriangium duriaei CBS 260.36 TaxID=1168546 RepID=A0A9P4J219_9PEZI|nr:hypothetical protein K461DRAFT_164089 [Myriangium duriaei CBS 260.36]